MANLRVWHASRDPYHCAFRLLRLLAAKKNEIELERLRILDMFLLYPSLLHRSSMPLAVKDRFRNLDIEKPESIFMHLPSPASVFQELCLYQNSAVAQLTAKGLISPEDLNERNVKLLHSEVPLELRERTETKNREDGGLTAFLVGPFSTIPLRGPESVYRKVGLPTRVIAA
jgi:hypothetical protein